VIKERGDEVRLIEIGQMVSCSLKDPHFDKPDSISYLQFRAEEVCPLIVECFTCFTLLDGSAKEEQAGVRSLCQHMPGTPGLS